MDHDEDGAAATATLHDKHHPPWGRRRKGCHRPHRLRHPFPRCPRPQCRRQVRRLGGTAVGRSLLVVGATLATNGPGMEDTHRFRRIKRRRRWRPPLHSSPPPHLGHPSGPGHSKRARRRRGRKQSCAATPPPPPRRTFPPPPRRRFETTTETPLSLARGTAATTTVTTTMNCPFTVIRTTA